MGTTVSYRTRAKGGRKQCSNPYGDRETSQRVTAVLGKKPNWATWTQYHAIAQAAPWKLDKIRVDTGPLALSARRVFEPSRTLTDSERAAVKRAHDELSRGVLDAAGYLGALAAVDAPMVSKGARR